MREVWTIAVIGCCLSAPAQARDAAPLPTTLLTSPPARGHASYRLEPGSTRAAYELDRLAAAGVRALKPDRGRYRGSPLDAKFEWRTSGADSRFGVGGGLGKVVRGLGD